MPSPFPGMNTYLEHPDFWPGVHHWLIIEIARYLGRHLRPKYVAAVEVRMYETRGLESTLIGIPDDVVIRKSQREKTLAESNIAVAEPTTQPITVNVPTPEIIEQGYLEVRRIGTGEVVTAIELLSPVNKNPGRGREQYESKREKILGSFTHLVEIDLLRRGQRMPILETIKSDYRILVSRSSRRPQADLYPFNLQDDIPIFSLPLQLGDREPSIDLKILIDKLYDEGCYDEMIDYRQEIRPRLAEEDSVWVDGLLGDRHLK